MHRDIKLLQYNSVTSYMYGVWVQMDKAYINFNNQRTRDDGVTKPVKKCIVCGKPGLLMWYKIHPEYYRNFNLDPSVAWKQLVCNHFKNGQSLNRNKFCNYVEKAGSLAIREAQYDEIKTTNHIIGKEEPELNIRPWGKSE